ncbi:DUF2207 domain-containing protein [Pelagibius marinus]|uniref:DUF2207 domain-containing protein n=1 Tax=Pelagibius marinus TaxID=2762760 RepID=UPI0018725F0F|nr:DUF2207 domain-containing protein [Pelagibius marinus]
MTGLCLRRALVALLALFVLAAPAAAQEDNDRIPRFAATIVVQDNGDLTVTEEIDFLVMPGSEKHGIYRDFPTTYRDALGLNTRVGFELLEVTRNGRAEPYLLQQAGAGIRIRIGAADVLIGEGIHRYSLTYRTSRQLFFNAESDEVYWNVTGNDWAHPIDRSEATVHLPAGAPVVDTAVFTGYLGEDGAEATVGRSDGGAVTFATTRTLEPGEGLTIVVAFPKGFVPQPGSGERLAAGLHDNLGLLVGAVGLLVVFAFFYLQWRAVGRDPDAGVIVPRFEAPRGLSPAGTGYVWARCRGTTLPTAQAFTVALTSLAIKGRLTIEEDDKTYVLEGRPRAEGETPARLPGGEAAALSRLFPLGNEKVEIERAYDAKIETAADKVMAALKREHAKVYFKHNTWHWLGGVVLALLGIAAALTLQFGDIEFLFMVAFGIIFIGGFTTPAALIAYKLSPLWAQALSGDTRNLAGTIFGSIFILPFFVPALGGVYLIFQEFGLLMALLVGLYIFLVVLFWFLMKAPTHLGRDLRDEIEGYRLYLSVAEASQMNLLTAEPEMTLDLFEHHLPYAMALGVEEQWTRRFTENASAAVQQAAESGRNWYRSRSGPRSFTGMAPALASGLSRTLSSAASPPSSSSSSGGGSSGGGGGGGGGGSW